jgi:hypothetical protein
LDARGAVRRLEQRRLPAEEVQVERRGAAVVAHAIEVGAEAFPLLPKRQVARRILDRVVGLRTQSG